MKVVIVKCVGFIKEWCSKTFRSILMKKTINDLYEEACDLKEIARTDINNTGTYVEAANTFNKAAGVLSKEIETEKDVKNQLIKMAFSSYYFYEETSCLSALNYQNQDINSTRRYIQKGQKWLNTAISSIEKIIGNCELNESELIKFRSHKALWEYLQKNDSVFENAAIAKEAWKNENFLDSLDYYRLAAEKSKELISTVEKLVNDDHIDPKYLRIASGNYIGMMTNVSSCLAQINYQKALKSTDQKQVNKLCKILLSYLLDAYRSANNAYEINPEWQQYLDGCIVMENNIKVFLQDNLNNWSNIYEENHSDKELLKFMKQVNRKAINKIEIEKKLIDFPIVKYWSIGSFYVLLFLTIVGSVYFLVTNIASFWKFIISIVAIETLFLIIGVFILRSTGLLSEVNFFKVIKLALENQFRIIRSKTKDDEKGQ